MNSQYSRTQHVLGKSTLNSIQDLKVIIFGVGGVGSATFEALLRLGIREITIVDYDVIDLSNLNRQIFTNQSNIGEYKVIALRERAEAIDPNINIKYHISKVEKGNLNEFNLQTFDYIVDAIDMVSSKLALIEYAYDNNIPIISSMGTGNKLRADLLKPMDIYETKYDPLSKIMRRELRKRNIKKLKVISSTEKPRVKSLRQEGERKSKPGSVSFLPPVAGYLIASEIINDYIKGVDFY